MTEHINFILKNLQNISLDIKKLSDTELKQEIKNQCNILLLQKSINFDQRNDLILQVFNKIRGLGVLQSLMDNPQITEIMVNSYNSIFVEINGNIYPCSEKFSSPEELNEMIQNIFTQCKRRIDSLTPIADGILNDGSRVNAILAPISHNGSSLTIRKFCGVKPGIEILLKQNFLNKIVLEFLSTLINSKQSLFICGGTGSGKTTLLNALSTMIDPNERIVSIEDSAELELSRAENWVRLESRMATVEGQGEISLSDLIKTALRMRPDRLIVGEVRGDEAYQLIHAANTGHPGSMSTGHANSCADMIRRLANLIMACTRLPYEVILKNLIAAFPFFLEVKRLKNGKRCIKEIIHVHKVNKEDFEYKTIFAYDQERNELIEKIDSLGYLKEILHEKI